VTACCCCVQLPVCLCITASKTTTTTVYNHYCYHYWLHHHHHKSRAQCPLMSDACFTIFCQLLRSSAKCLSSCRFPPHHYTISSVHSLCGRPLLFLSSTFPKSSIFSFLSSDIRLMCPNSCSFLSINVCSRLCSWPIFLVSYWLLLVFLKRIRTLRVVFHDFPGPFYVRFPGLFNRVDIEQVRFSMIFHDFLGPRPNTMTFEAWKIWILNSMTFQDLYAPCLSDTPSVLWCCSLGDKKCIQPVDVLPQFPRVYFSELAEPTVA